MASDADLPQTRLSRSIDYFLTRLGAWVSLIWLALLAVIVVNVMLRYLFNEGRIELEELQWHLYSIGFLLGLSYAYQADTHIRVDVVHERLSPRARAWIELYGIVLFLAPFITLVLVYSVPFVVSSFNLSEQSPSPGGLPMRWFIKAFLPIGFALLALAVFSRLTRVWALLFLTGAKHGR
ncbi:MAG: TRAP transporter small permease subunit [Gammaproteobacteria bacterium]|jgi:TRAP-type mannitol/chloroaromatic compound transport system permease small subunit|nr:TRAP transporter small permease subunit [Gammaproteobacteria bacterium]